MLGRILERNKSDESVTIERSVCLGELEFSRMRLSSKFQLSTGNDTMSSTSHVNISCVIGCLELFVDVLELSLTVEVSGATVENSFGSSLDHESEITTCMGLLDDDESGLGLGVERNGVDCWASIASGIVSGSSFLEVFTRESCESSFSGVSQQLSILERYAMK